MNKWIIVRAGCTAWQEENRLQGTMPLPLCEAGEAELQRIAVALREHQPESLYSSGNESSGKTAEFLARCCELKTRKVPQLREMDCGLWQGLRISEIQQRYASAYKQWRADPTCIAPCKGETLQQVCDRVTEGLQAIRKKSREGTIVIVAAHLVSAVIDCILTETPLQQLWTFADQPAAVRIYHFSDSDNAKPTQVETWQPQAIPA